MGAPIPKSRRARGGAIRSAAEHRHSRPSPPPATSGAGPSKKGNVGSWRDVDGVASAVGRLTPADGVTRRAHLIAARG
jgi:hypothetical protein